MLLLVRLFLPVLALAWQTLVAVMQGDVRCVFVATVASQSFLTSNRHGMKYSRKQEQDRDICLTEALVPAFRDAVRDTPFETLSPADCHILGAVALRPRERVVFRDATLIGPEAEHQLSHWTALAGRPLDGFALLFDVSESMLLQQPQEWFTIAGRRGGCFFTELESGQQERLRSVWPEECHPVFSYPFTQVLRLPYPYAMLILAKQWSVVVVPDLPVAWNHDSYGMTKGRKFVSGLVGGQRKRIEQWPALRVFGKRPALEEAVSAQAAGAAKQIDCIHDPVKLWGLADCVAALGQGADDFVDPTVWKDFVEGMRYQHAESLLLASKRHAYVAVANHGFAFNIGFLVESMLCAMTLNSDGELAHAMKLAACLLLPEKLAAAWIDRLTADDRLYLPSKAIISQRRAALDMGFALLQQAKVQASLLSESISPGIRLTIQQMRRKIVQLIPPPTTLGGRSANAGHRLSAFLHSLHLIAGDFTILRQLLKSVVSITTDLGVESLLTRLEPFELSAMLPFFEPPRADKAESCQPQASDCQGGLLHIIHNATKDLGSCMECYDEQVSKMSVLAKFLRERHSKERLLAKCFSQGLPGEAVFKQAVSKFRSQCYRGRWGTVASCALDLQEVLPAVRWGWSLPKYLEGGAVAGQGEAEGASIAEVDALVRCPFFEAYLSMLVLLSEVTLHLIAWSEGCPCHWHLLTGGGAASMDASTRCLLESCPMRGRRAPELALNDFMQELSALSSHGATSLVQGFPPDLPVEERTKIVQDFELGRSFLTAVLTLKTSHFRSFPWCAAGLAHHDQERAREVWNRIRCLSDEGPEAVRLRKQLPRLFSRDVLQQGDQWCCGADLSSCPLFAAEIAGLALIPTAERRVEAQHARTQKGSKKSPCHSPAYMSLQIRAKDLRDAMCGNPKDFVAQLAPCVNECRSYKKAAKTMRLGLHPAFVESSRPRDRRVRDLLYRADMLSQHQTMPEVFVRDPATKSARRPAPPTAEEHAVEATALGPILHRLALEHVLDRLPVVRNSGEPVVFAVAYESGAFALLREFLLPSQEQQPMPMLTYSSSEVVASDEIVEASGPGPRREIDVLFQKISQAEATHHQMTGVFFKLLPSMSKMKRFQADGELRLSSTDLPIALLRAASFSQERRELLVDSELLNMRSAVRGLAVDDLPCVLSFSSLSLSQLKSLRVLKVDPSIVYCLRSCQDYSPPLSDSRALRVVLEKIFLKGKAGVADTSSFTAEQRSLLLPLQQNGLLTEDPPFKLTDKGLRHVCLANAVTHPRLLLAKLPVPPVEQSKWQLLQTLLDDGWEARVCRASQCRSAVPFDHRVLPASKILFLVQQKSGVVVDRLYLLALTLAVQHDLQPVRHGQSADVYRRLLSGVPDLALPEPRASRARVRAFRAIAEGDEWLDHVPVRPPARKRRRLKQQQRPEPLPEGGAHPAAIERDDGGASAVCDASPVAAVEDAQDAQDGPGDSDDAGDVDALLRMIDEIDEDEAAAEVEIEAAEAAADSADDGGGVGDILPSMPEPAPAEPSYSGNSSSSGSTSDSDSSSGTSDSSSGDSSGSGSGSISTGSGATDGAPAPKAKAKAKAKSKAKGKAKAKARAGGGGALGPLTFFWRGCKFTPIKGSDGSTTGYEATCKHAAHEQCRRTLLFSAHGGEDNALLKLKWWCLQARHYANRQEHVHRCPHSIPGVAPAAAQLDAQGFGFD
ncbi:unnamed protein product [Symbiodinium sp. CCMP2592]|nr:unnamed protein product [Symbiodinium sp. CCMP2592]